MTTDILCFGEAMVELSAIQETNCRIAIAGDTFNTAVYLSRAGHRVGYVSAVGTCPFSTKLLGALGDENIDATSVPALPDQSVGLYAISVDDHGERSFTYWRSESAVRSLFESENADAVASALKDVETLYLSGITLSLYTAEAQRQILGILADRKNAGKRNTFDGNFRPRNWQDHDQARDIISEAISLSTWSMPTFDDEAMLFGDTSPEDTAKRHLDLGVDEVTVKHGAAGALVNGNHWVRPPETIKPIDTTGAGDSFNAAYLSSRLRGEATEDAALAGHRLAGQVLKVPGALIPS